MPLLFLMFSEVQVQASTEHQGLLELTGVGERVHLLPFPHQRP